MILGNLIQKWKTLHGDQYFDFNDRSSEEERVYSLFGRKTVNLVEEGLIDEFPGFEWGPPSDYEYNEEAEESLDIGEEVLFK